MSTLPARLAANWISATAGGSFGLVRLDGRMSTLRCRPRATRGAIAPGSGAPSFNFVPVRLAKFRIPTRPRLPRAARPSREIVEAREVGVEKLVRDRIPEMLSGRGIPYEVRVADRSEMAALLRAKLVEEAAELSSARDSTARIEELADVLEVVLALGRLYGIDRESLERVRAVKAVERGTFEARIVLIS